MTYDQLRGWADELRKTISGIDYPELRKAKNREKANRHYDSVISQDKVEIYCDFCKEKHTALRLTSDKNIARNGRYICEREGGHIAGSLPKPHLIKENPYVGEGKKQCLKCETIKLFEEFGADKSRRDGYATNCKVSRAEANKI